MDGIDARRVITLRQAARLAGVSDATIQRWIEGGFLKIVPRWGRERGLRVLLREVLECMETRRRGNPKGRNARRGTPRCNKRGLWYERQIANTRLRRLFETDDEYNRRITWQREYKRRKDRERKLNATR